MERCLWVAVTALEELLAPGRDLQRLDGTSGKALCAGLRDRVCRLQADAETLRRVAAANRAVVLPVGDERVPRAFGPRVAGVVLTGIGAAGVHDLIAVKAAGGLPRVQDAR